MVNDEILAVRYYNRIVIERNIEMKQYIANAGGSIVSKSILNRTSKLKWLFKPDSSYGNGWIAFGDTDTQEYVDDPKNMENRRF